MLKQSLQLKMSQQLTMTPQLQQAIKLLQLSTLDLQQEIQQALDSNPMLEVAEDSNDDSKDSDNNLEELNTLTTASISESGAVADNAAQDSNLQSQDISTPDFDPQENAEAAVQAQEQEWTEKIPTDLPVDSNWEDVYQPGSTTSSSSSAPEEDRDYEKNGTTESLQEHLMWQLNLTHLSDKDKLIGYAIIDSVEPSGMLSTTMEDVHSGFDEALEIELDEVFAVQHLIQQFDPIGAASRDLSECLSVQLNQFNDDVEHLTNAKNIVDGYLEQLANRDYKQIIRKLKIDESELKACIELIQTLNPHPGEQIAIAETAYVIPDVFVKKIEGRWLVELNPDIAPKVRINSGYASMVKRADSSTDNTYLKDNLQEARWFLKSLQSRNETLMKVSTQIVEHQRGFLEYGDEAMKPLVLHEIAEAVEMHESTISRVTTQKYMHTPRGVFELKYFFSSHVSTSTGGECSSTAIRAMIKKLVAEESAKKPLSDNKISKLLSEQGIEVARRTIAKYRESMAIPPSNERKRLV